jgi:1-deoxy-D-xylulose-5-phosphate reductoisomerase
VKTVSIFGATGTLGAAALDVVRLHPDKFSIDTLTAGGNCDALDDICRSIEHKTALSLHKDGEEAIVEAANRKVDIVIMAIAGMAALKPTLAAIRLCEQGSFGRRRRFDDGGSRETWRNSFAAGQRAQRDFSVPARQRH